MPEGHATIRRSPLGRAGPIPGPTQGILTHGLGHARTPSQDVPNDWLQKEPTSPTLNQNTNFSFAIKNNMDYYVGSSQAGPFVVASFAPRVAKKKPDSDYGDAFAGTPFEVRHGRRYLRDSSYALPCDLFELHRQSLASILSISIFGSPICSPTATTICPRNVLELGCGSAFWTSSCHEYFKSRDRHGVSFVGVDIAPLAPDLGQHGVKWKFVQHDLRKFPWPFEEEQFDFIMVKDLGLAVPGHAAPRFLEECLRILAPAGNIEVWDSDAMLRSLRSQDCQMPAVVDNVATEMALSTATYLIDQGSPLARAQNSFLEDFNGWMQDACETRQMSLRPLMNMAEILGQSDRVVSAESRRVAIPLAEMLWDKERVGLGIEMKAPIETEGQSTERPLTPDQVAIRSAAMLTFIQKVESLEPVLMEASGKNAEEWATWWSELNLNLLEHHGASAGECLEIGAVWATKL